ncbi:hypothetical protein [Anderseniella sp. Alg231-50]|uniref:hypothetical protein n=1 Tax=Anderseniella sp. Alg231-50 TaxID=1922226 RepID=UPI00307C83B3
MVHFECLDEKLANRLEFLAAEPEMSQLPEVTHKIGTTKVHKSFYDFRHPYEGSAGTCDHLLNRAHKILRDLMIAEAPNCPVIHGASVVANGKRFLLMAEKRVGKTTLSLKCLAHGLTVEGDEHVVVRSSDVVARPRTLRVKQSSVSVVPEMAQQIQRSPSVAEWHGDLIYSVTPRLAGQKWTITPGQAHALVFLTANHGGMTSIKFLTANEAFERLAKTVYLPENGRAAALGRLRMLVSGAQRIEMRLGCLEKALWHLRQLSHA